MNLKEEIKDIFFSVAESGIPMACELIFDGVLGTVMPGVMDSVLAYKQKRSEKMYLAFMQELKNRVDELEHNLQNMKKEKYLEMKEKYFGLVSDYVLNEVQEEKIKYLASGFINMSKIEELNEDFVLFYYDTLQQLRVIDIAILRFYGKFYVATEAEKEKSAWNIMEEFSIDFEQYNSIREKLERLGLLVTKRDKKEDDLYKNLNEIQEYLTNLDKGKQKKLKSLKKLEKNNSFELSKYGRDFLLFFNN